MVQLSSSRQFLLHTINVHWRAPKHHRELSIANLNESLRQSLTAALAVVSDECAALLREALRENFSLDFSTWNIFLDNFFHSEKHQRVRCDMYKFNLKPKSTK